MTVVASAVWDHDPGLFVEGEEYTPEEEKQPNRFLRIRAEYLMVDEYTVEGLTTDP